jgi:hypothetical protein
MRDGHGWQCTNRASTAVAAALTVKEYSDKLVLALDSLSDLVCLHVWVVAADVRAVHEPQSEQLVSAVEDSLAHSA